MDVFKIALPTHNALTDTDPSHFSVYFDGTSNHVLVKEKSRGTTSVNASSTTNISHALGYFPLTHSAAEVSSGEFEVLYGQSPYNPRYTYVTTSSLVLANFGSGAKNFSYLIFHDQL